ncbi:DUF397 domain-containing protein [Streptomyces sp. NPDC127178]|uniref:DUF397 domain-containing protein n=1 Tax=unclassified Streptomyces TaxID=2593676 RepID=UPI00362E84D7
MTERTVQNAATLSGWRKSSHSDNNAGSCLEVLDNHPSGVPVRDSKVPHGPALVFSAANWSAFLTAVKESRP